MVSLPLMRRCLRCHRDGVVALVAMASLLLLLPMRRRLAIVDNDGDSTTGNSIDDNYDKATNINNDYDGATDDDIDYYDCDGQRC